MGLNYRKRISLGNGTTLNIGNNGISSVSQKVGNATINSKGTMSVKLGNGMTYRTSSKSSKNKGDNHNSSNLSSLLLLSLMTQEKKTTNGDKTKHT